jgi:hypothetical protein
VGVQGMISAEVGKIYLHKKFKAPVQVLTGRTQRWTGEGYLYMFLIENLVSGQNYYLTRLEMSEEPLNEMELLGWMAN